MSDDIPEQKTPNPFEEHIEQIDFEDPLRLSSAPLKDKIAHLPDAEKRQKFQAAYLAYVVADFAYYSAIGEPVDAGILEYKVPKDELEKTAALIEDCAEEIREIQLDWENGRPSADSMAYGLTIQTIKTFITLGVNQEYDIPPSKFLSDVDEDIEIVQQDPTLLSYLENTLLPVAKQANIEAQVNETLKDVEFEDENAYHEPPVREQVIEDAQNNFFHKADLGYAGTEMAVRVYKQALEAFLPNEK